jgi:hypothetical protein
LRVRLRSERQTTGYQAERANVSPSLLNIVSISYFAKILLVRERGNWRARPAESLFGLVSGRMHNPLELLIKNEEG